MQKHKKHHRLIATFFLLIFFPTLIPNNLFASNNGPKSPEAGSFEPVDATDMVNLITGQYSYVLPLLNVPSPEGGYPIALGYHAGIALEQEASWTGLGWNVNPGAIDRSINGYADDYKAATIKEYFYDVGKQEYASFLSVSYSNAGASVGVGFNWGSNQALGGFVSVGYGMDLGGGNSLGINATIGTAQSSIGVGAQLSGGLSVGASVGTEGDVAVEAGFNSNGGGFSVGYNTSGSYSFNANANNSLGFSLSTSSAETRSTVTVGGIGMSTMSTSFHNTINSGDYRLSVSSSNSNIFVPTPIGIFSLSFGKQKFIYRLGKNVINKALGPIYFDYPPSIIQTHSLYGWTDYEYPFYWQFMDIYEVPINDNQLDIDSNIEANNITFPAYDNYNIQAQGLSGNMSPIHYQNGSLFGISEYKDRMYKTENDDGHVVQYSIHKPIGSSTPPDFARFVGRPNFYLNNEVSSYLDANVSSAIFNSNLNNSNILEHYDKAGNSPSKPRRHTSTFVEYFTNNDVITNSAELKLNGYLKENASGFDRGTMPKDGIGAFKITTSDGKTYHYSLPVYNMISITRTFGVVAQRPLESQSHMEKTQLEPYATHWLLTAITGPDFVDNGDGVAGEGDLGYWTSFEYGKWTDAFIWKAPFKKDYIIDENNPNIKTWIRGRKQLYYLDKVKTRTHSALFIKSERTDSSSENWTYSASSKQELISGSPYDDSYKDWYTIPSQKQLRLDKIILLKNIDNNVDKKAGIDNNQSVTLRSGDAWHLPEITNYNMYDNVLDNQDNWQECVAKAIKVINFNYDYSLVPGDNRLTLKSVDFKGKTGISVIPPYKFDYINDTNSFNIDNQDGWGYLIDKAYTFSLNKITTPQGGTINIGYENNKCKSINDHKFKFYDTGSQNIFFDEFTNAENKLEFKAKSKFDIGIEVGSILNVNYQKKIDQWSCYYLYTPKAVVTELLGNNVFKLQSLGPIHTNTNMPNGSNMNIFSGDYDVNRYSYEINQHTYNLVKQSVVKGGGIRVANLKVSDGINNYFTDYKYGQNEDGVGYVSYMPYAQNLTKEVSYSAELPAPRVMYEYVTMSSHKEGFAPESKIRYKFNVMKSKDPNKIKYGDFYEIVENKQPTITNTSTAAPIDISVIAFTVKDNLASIGQLLEVAIFNGQGQQLSKISNTYYGMNDNTTNMGLSQESYQTYKSIDYTDNSTKRDKWNINSSARIKYPSIIKSSTEQKNGYTYTTQFNDYDLISGVSKEQVFTSSDGQSFKTKTIPAYLKYAEMGSKVDNINNKNMLSQTAAEYSYILDGGIWKETGVGITTWSNIWSYKDIAGTSSNPSDEQGVWRKHKTYVWNGVKDGDGIFLGSKDSNGVVQDFDKATDDHFNWTVPIGVGIPVRQPTQWKQISEVTLYDHYSAPLEMKDINGNFASTKMGDNDTKVMATGNAGYNEMFYAGGENIKPTTRWLEPEVSVSDASLVNSTYFHTGKNSVGTTNASQFGVGMKSGQHRAGKYKVSVWIKKDNAANAILTVNGIPKSFQADKIFSKNLQVPPVQVPPVDWQLKTAYIDVPIGDCTINLSSSNTSKVYYDDLMIRPVASSITGYVYNEWDELSYIIGNNGLATHFEYDAAGRLIETYSEVIEDQANGLTGGFKLTSKNIINYKNLP